MSKFLQLRFNVFLYLTFGWHIAKIYIFLFGKLYFFFNSRENRCIKNAISEVIGYRDREANIRVIMKKALDGILSHYYEKLFIAFEEPEKATKFLKNNIISDDLIVLYQNLLKGNGVIVVTGHYGAIEYIPTLLAVNNFTTSMIAKFKTEQLRKKVFAQAKKYNIRLIDSEKTGNVIRAAIKELKENRILITECDEIEEWRASVKEETSFLGKKTGLDRTINVIQKRTGAEIVFGIIHRYNLNKYKLIMYAYEDMLQILNDIAPASAGETVLKFLERYIYSNPEQWYQWKNYNEIKTFPSPETGVASETSLPLLKPELESLS
ncbi:MAG: lysophospholipid acyltransferase family protein [Deltaproteobacteria bacterium]|nr:lysophospholipid acyltransferase family protein [Deltaproteobacteria bacterium]